MKKHLIALSLALVVALLVATGVLAAFTNGGFEDGNWNGWTGPDTFLNPGLTPPGGPFDHNSIVRNPGGSNKSAVVTAGVDPIAGINKVLTGTYSARINSETGNGRNANAIKQTLTVGVGDVQGDGSIHVSYAYAPVMEDPGHSPEDQPYFFVGLKNVNTGQYLYETFAYANQPGYPWQSAGAWKYMDWYRVDIISTAANPIMSVGDTLELEVIAAGCSLGGHAGYVYVDDFGFNPPGGGTPNITNVTPNNGPDSGGTTVTVTGTSLDTVTSLTIGQDNIGSGSFISQNATTIVFTTPGDPAGLVDITVINPTGSATAANIFEYLPCLPPTITNVTPNAGLLAGGTAVTITGTHFNEPGCAITTVYFDNPSDVPGPAAAAFTIISNTQINATSPSGAAAGYADGGDADVGVIGLGGEFRGADLFTYVPPPTITNFTPNIGPDTGGQVVTITGTYFKPLTGWVADRFTTNWVHFGPTNAAGYTVDSPTQITATTPAYPSPFGCGLVDISLHTDPEGGMATLGKYLFVPPPTITNVSLDVGPTTGGSPVVITGTNFMGGPCDGLSWTSQVTFDGTPAVCTVNSATQISCTTPPHVAGQVDINVTTPGGQATRPDGFTYVQPAYLGVDPNYGPTTGGTAVILTGVGFTGATGVTFGGTACTGLVVVSDTEIRCNTPAHAAGLVEIVVIKPGDDLHFPNSFTYVPPAVVGVNPNAGPTYGGTSVIITGLNFGLATNVLFDGTAATSFTIDSPTQITAITPPHAAGTVDVNITGGNPATIADSFTFIPPAVFADIYPNFGPIIGGTPVVITGANLGSATAVTFDGVPAASIALISPNQIRVYTPAHPADLVDITITTPGGLLVYPDSFTFYGSDLPLAPFSVPVDGATLIGEGPTRLQVTFDEPVLSVPFGDPSWPFSALNPANYLLVEENGNHDFDTLTCLGGVQVDDDQISVDAVLGYDAATFTATLAVNHGVPLPIGSYRLFACGTTSVKNLAGVKLNGGLNDTRFHFKVRAAELPPTGFAPGVITTLPLQPADKAYLSYGDLWLEIPKLGVKATIVGVSANEGEWDVTWLGNSAGWLEGSIFPTWAGNSVITAHVWDAYNNPGPFLYLNQLWWGDQIIIHAWGQQYVYEVRSVREISPSNSAAVFKHQDFPSLTLLTCRSYDQNSGTYKSRVMVRAVLVEIR
ncbi:MAG: IPT/TIG domain-containing protein [Chloroflexota bacterium]